MSKVNGRSLHLTVYSPSDLCFVNCNNHFVDHPKIINGASDLLIKIFGEQGQHTRFAVGSNSLPLNISVEIEAIIKLK